MSDSSKSTSGLAIKITSAPNSFIRKRAPQLFPNEYPPFFPDDNTDTFSLPSYFFVSISIDASVEQLSITAICEIEAYPDILSTSVDVDTASL